MLDRGSAGQDGLAVNVSYADGALQYQEPSSCISIPSWLGLDPAFTLVTSFQAPLAPEDVYTVWEAGLEEAAARLYVVNGTLSVSYGSAYATGGGAVQPGAVVRVGATCDVSACFIYT